MKKHIRIGTRESQLAVWQAEQVRNFLAQNGYTAELVYIKSEGDIDLRTPLYEMGVQGVFTRCLDTALLNDNIDIAVHSMKDVPTQLAKGIVQAAILKRGSYKDLFVYKEGPMVNGQWSMINNDPAKVDVLLTNQNSSFTLATSSIRRKAQWLNRYPNHKIETLRGNVNTRLKKVGQGNWKGAVFAAAGLERIGLRPKNSIELDWMLPAPGQGAIMVVCREGDKFSLDVCADLDHADTATCVKIERDFLRTLLGGCSTPISALAEIKNEEINFKGNILSLDGKDKVEVVLTCTIRKAKDLGFTAAKELLNKGGQVIADSIRHATE